ncbi:MAG: hypothetical protein ACP5FH_07585 [Terracidiphilus sp.]
MMLRRSCWMVLWASVFLSPALARRPRPCVTVDQASKMTGKSLCVAAHVYDVVQLPDGTRFLDVCSPQTPDSACRFTIISLRQDRKDVGDLSQYRGRDVRIRGVVQPVRGRAEMILSHIRQFSGGRPRFRPNPMLLGGFDASQDLPSVYDPNLYAHGRSRSFMNSRDQESLPGK